MGKLKIKKGVKKIFGIVIVLALLLSIGIFSYIKIYNQKQYEKTYEYKLTNIGYNENEIDTILDKFKETEIEYILQNEKNDNYLNLVNEKYFIYDNFYEYVDYQKDHLDKPLTNIVEIINTETDKEYYTETTKTSISDKELMLVNKYHYLDESYKPETLVSISTTYAWGEYGSKKVTQETYDAFMNLWNDSHEQGYYLMVSSAYRDYNHQQSVYNDYKDSRGTEYADSIAARAGYSEHQTGYVIDMFEKGSTQKTFHETESYACLLDNAHKYGFILIYPEDKEDVTGYSFESWHYRYVGVEAATYIYKNHITFDEYYAYFVK